MIELPEEENDKITKTFFLEKIFFRTQSPIFLFCLQNMNDIYDPLVMATFLEQRIIESVLNDYHTEQGAGIILDLRQYPYFSESADQKYNFQHAGLECSLRRNGYMIWCGYAKQPDDIFIDFAKIEVHDGITGSDQKGAAGFDCHGFYDFDPETFIRKAQRNESENRADMDKFQYRTYQFAVDEVKKLAERIVKQAEEIPDFEGLDIKGE